MICLLRAFFLLGIGIVVLANICDVDPREGMFHATALGRATNYIFRNCTPMLKDLHVKANAKLLNDLIKFTCGVGETCVAKVGEEMPKYTECVIGMIVANWSRISEFDDHDIQIGVNVMRCGYPMIPDLNVMRHFVLYLRKISG